MTLLNYLRETVAYEGQFILKAASAITIGPVKQANYRVLGGRCAPCYVRHNLVRGKSFSEGKRQSRGELRVASSRRNARKGVGLW